MDFKGKKLLVLAGASVHNKVVRTAKEMGLYVIVSDYLEPNLSPAKQLADESWMYSITDVDAIVERCKEEHVAAVLSFCIDPAQKPYQHFEAGKNRRHTGGISGLQKCVYVFLPIKRLRHHDSQPGKVV